jgi:hypothetical protein
VSHLEQLVAAIDRLAAAVDDKDVGELAASYEQLREVVVMASEAERASVAGRLAPVVAEIPVLYGASLAAMTGAMVGVEGAPAPVLDVLVERACGVMEDAIRFVRNYRDLVGGTLSREEVSYDEVAERFEAAVGDRLESPRRLVAAWWVGQDWVQPVLFLCQRADVRRTLPQRDRLRAAAEALEQEFSGVAPWLVGLLRVLDDEKLAVLHRQTGRGFWVTIGGVGDNFQLHTLLAARLLAPAKRGLFFRAKGLVPGTGPTAAMAAAADGTGDPMPTGGISGQFNLVDAHGAWIWNEGRPDEIPIVDGHRVVVLDPPPYQRSWNAGRAYPLMVPSVLVEPMGDEVSRAWIARVSPAKETNPAEAAIVPAVAADGSTWTDDMRIALPSGRTVADVVDLVLAAVAGGSAPEDVEAALATQFNLSKDDAALARDRALGGIMRAGTGDETNRPSPVKDPIAHEAYQRALTDPTLPARYFPDLFDDER